MSRRKPASRTSRGGMRHGARKHHPPPARLTVPGPGPDTALRRAAQLTVCGLARSRADAVLLLEACGLLPGQEDPPWRSTLLPPSLNENLLS